MYRLHNVEGDNLRNFMKIRSKHRLNFNCNCNKILTSFENDIDIFILKLTYKYVSPIEDFFKKEIRNM